MRVRPLVALLLFLAIACTESKPAHRSTFDIPSTWERGDSVLPVSYLESLDVGPPRTLGNNERMKLAALIAAAHEDSIAQYRQSYYLRADTPIGRMIETNFPEVRTKKSEGNRYYLGDLSAVMIPPPRPPSPAPASRSAR